LSRPTARVLALLELLQSGGAHTAVALASRLGVDERTVRRYAVHLADLGIPVEAARGRYGGYRLAPGHKLPPLMLSDDEAVAVALGLVAGGRAGLATADGGAAQTALAKVRRVLPATLARRVESLLSTVDITGPARSGTPPETVVLLDIAAATRDRHTVSFGYTAWDGRTGTRTVDPYGLVFHTGRWYVTGHDHDRRAVRTFRLDRIAGVHATRERYEIPRGFDPAAHVLAGIANVPWRHEVLVVLHVGEDEARQRIPPSVGELTGVDGGVRLRARVERLDGMARFLAGLGWPFTIEHPDALRDEVRALAARLAADAARQEASDASRRSASVDGTK
jgi:predicted DNA-binding transcriptional regulator YafY